jgi:hypothetical protein
VAAKRRLAAGKVPGPGRAECSGGRSRRPGDELVRGVVNKVCSKAGQTVCAPIFYLEAHLRDPGVLFCQGSRCRGAVSQERVPGEDRGASGGASQRLEEAQTEAVLRAFNLQGGNSEAKVGDLELVRGVLRSRGAGVAGGRVDGGLGRRRRGRRRGNGRLRGRSRAARGTLQATGQAWNHAPLQIRLFARLSQS